MILTKREKQILQLIVREHESEEIASMLSISLHTVQSHRKNIYRKTGAQSLVGLIKYAFGHGIA